jgi:predicted acylesterase/phospholipase RssA
VLRQIEGLIGCRLHERFDLIYGTSTGAIIAALLALGHEVEEIHKLYKAHVPTIMKQKNRREKSKALAELADEVFGKTKFDAVKTNVGIVTTKWMVERPMIFKGSIAQAHGRVGSFVPGFGCTIGDAVQASCSAYPFFERKFITTAAGDRIELIDGGYCANNPTLYAIADATVAMKVKYENVRVVSVGVGEYPPIKRSPRQLIWWLDKFPEFELVQKTFDINTQSMEQLRAILFKQIATIRINESFTKPDMATDLFEHDLKKLNILRQRGSESYAQHEAALKEFLL